MDCGPVTSQTKSRVAASFGAASDVYSDAAGLQLVVAENLAGKIAGLSLPTRPRVLELGCGTGFLNLSLRPIIGCAEWLVSDIAYPMVSRCRRELGQRSDTMYLAMDAERPAVGGGFDLVCASLVFQWMDDMPGAIRGLAGLLRPGGHLAFSTIARGSLVEWIKAHDDLGLCAATPDYPDVKEIKSMWSNGPSVIEKDEIIRVYESAHSFAATLKAIGAATPLSSRPALGPGSLRRVLRHLDRKRQGAGVAISWHIAYGLFTRGGG